MLTPRNLAVFVVASATWAAFFYAMDRYLMTIQGLPVGANLMPL